MYRTHELDARHEIKRIDKDLFKLVQASGKMNEFLEAVFNDYDETKGDTVALLEEVMVTDERVAVSLRQENQIALLWTAYR